MTIRVEPDRKRVVVLHGSRLLGELIYQIQSLTGWLESVSFERHGDVVRVRLTGAEIVDSFDLGDDSLMLRRTWRFQRDGQYRLSIDYRILEPELSNWMMPANRYTEPPPTRLDLPTGGLRAGWSFDERRLPVPAGIYYGGGRHQWLALLPAADGEEPASLKSFQSERLPAVQVGIPSWEEPRVLAGPVGAPGTAPDTRWYPVGRRTGSAPGRDCEVARTVVIGTGDDAVPAQVLDRLHRTVWRGEPERAEPDWSLVMRMRLRYLGSRLAFRRGDGCVGVRLSGTDRTPMVSAAAPTSSIAAAVAICRLDGVGGRRVTRREAVEIGRFFLGGRRSDGAFCDAFSFTDGWYSLQPASVSALPGAVNLQNSARAMTQMVALYDCLRRAREDHPELIRVAADVGEFAVRNQIRTGPEGAYPGVVPVARSGPGSEIDPARYAMGGLSCVSLLCALERSRGRNSLRAASLKRAAVFYRNRTYDPVLVGAHGDADRDMAVNLLRALLDLYELREDPADLAAARAAAGHLLGWIWAYDIPGLRGRLGEGVRTQGLAAPSVERKHLDFEGWSIARELFRLHIATGDPHYGDVARAALAANAQLIAGIDLRGRHPRGWQPAELDHSDWSGIRRFGRRKGDYGGERVGAGARELVALLDIAALLPDAVPLMQC